MLNQYNPAEFVERSGYSERAIHTDRIVGDERAVCRDRFDGYERAVHTDRSICRERAGSVDKKRRCGASRASRSITDERKIQKGQPFAGLALFSCLSANFTENFLGRRRSSVLPPLFHPPGPSSPLGPADLYLQP